MAGYTMEEHMYIQGNIRKIMTMTSSISFRNALNTP